MNNSESHLSHRNTKNLTTTVVLWKKREKSCNPNSPSLTKTKALRVRGTLWTWRNGSEVKNMAALPEDPSLAPCTYKAAHKYHWNTSSKGFDVLLRPLQALHAHNRYIHVSKIAINLIFLYYLKKKRHNPSLGRLKNEKTWHLTINAPRKQLSPYVSRIQPSLATN